MKLKNNTKLRQLVAPDAPGRLDYLLCFAILVATLFLFAHTDIQETANHSWLLLDGLFRGELLSFYETVFAHENTMYYLNAAHYNIVLYLIFGIFLLPIWLASKLFSFFPSETLLYFWCKIGIALIALGGAWLLKQLAAALGCGTQESAWAGLFFLLSPLTLVGCFAMGQYDVVCLFFILWAMLYYQRDKLLEFCLIMGVATCCKSFALFILVPLLLLREKRIFRLAGYGLLSLWLAVPTMLLFHGRDGDMGYFNGLMTNRLFAETLPAGPGRPQLFFVLYGLLAVFAYLYRPENREQRDQMTVYSCLAVFSILFLCTFWHPQWLVLLVPFLVLTTLKSKNKLPWFYIETVLSIGFLLLCYLNFPGQIEANLFNLGVWRMFTPKYFWVGEGSVQMLTSYFAMLPRVNALAPAMFCVSLLSMLIFKLPLRRGIVADRLAGGEATPFAPRLMLLLTTGVGYFCFFFLPVLFQWIGCLLLQ